MKKIKMITLGLMLAILGVLATGCTNPDKTDNKGTTNTSTTTPTTTKGNIVETVEKGAEDVKEGVDNKVNGTTATPKK